MDHMKSYSVCAGKSTLCIFDLTQMLVSMASRSHPTGQNQAKDIVAGIWNGWIDFGRDPVTAIAVPFAIPQAFNRWDELRRTVNIILDRIRLAELIEVNVVDDLAAIQAWNGKERSFLSSST